MEGSPVPANKAAMALRSKDALTGLYQQDYLFSELNRLLQENKAVKIEATLALLQLENFYEIRRWVGKPEADLLLGDIARLLTRSLPRSVLLCRCEHYEFAALLLEDSSIHAHLLIQRVKQALLSAVSASLPPQLELKCGVGLVPLAPAIPSAQVMFARARHNLSRALSRQRMDGEMGGEPGPVLSMKPAQILYLLRNQQLALSFQALLNLKSGHCRHYEVRCRAALDNATFQAAELFECANHNALGEHLDRWVIAACIKVLSQTGSGDLQLTVNLTLNTLVSAQFFPWLHSQFALCPDLSAHLLFQISELDLLTAQHHMQFFCEQLGRANINLGISHFGCTPDPFRYLSLLRAHHVKLDVSWLENIRSDPARREQLLALSRRLLENGLRIIAAGVEDMRLLPLLWTAGVHLVQGYCLHRPTHSPQGIFFSAYTLDLSLPAAQRTN